MRRILAGAGIEINGTRDWDLQVHQPGLYRRVIAGGSLAWGESYMDGWWDVTSLDGFFTRVFEARLEKKLRGNLRLLLTALRFRLLNMQSRRRAHLIGEQHYDTGNDLFERMLDPSMAYSCGYWQRADNLAQAQHDKLDLICRKLGLEQGMKLLDIGSGWGSLLYFAAQNYGIKATGITVSRQQLELARQRCRDLPVRIELQDYRQHQGQYDHIASVGMAEHVGYKNYPVFMQTVHKCLRPGGLFLLHTIGSNRSVRRTDPWIEKYIFPNSMLPSIQQLSQAADPWFVLEDIHSFGPDYDSTLMAWHENFVAGWPEIKEHYDKRFYRMWRYYLLTSAAAFRSRRIQLWQIVLGRAPRRGSYEVVR